MIPAKLSGVDVAFGPRNIRNLLPPYESDRKADRAAEEFVSLWFFSGIATQAVDALVAVDGVDKNAALTHIKACLGSFEPSHEHKKQGCATLLREWFGNSVEAALKIAEAQR